MSHSESERRRRRNERGKKREAIDHLWPSSQRRHSSSRVVSLSSHIPSKNNTSHLHGGGKRMMEIEARCGPTGKKKGKENEQQQHTSRLGDEDQWPLNSARTRGRPALRAPVRQKEIKHQITGGHGPAIRPKSEKRRETFQFVIDCQLHTQQRRRPGPVWLFSVAALTTTTTTTQGIFSYPHTC